MTGTLFNVAAIIIGTIIGMTAGRFLTKRIQETVVAGMGIFTVALGLDMFFDSENVLIPLGAIIIGAIVGEVIGIEKATENLGGWINKQFIKITGIEGSESKFIKGFMTATLLFGVGPITLLGSINDGLTGNYELLAIKAVLDGFISIAFASTFGIGVAFSAIIIFIFQGTVTLFAAQFQAILTDSMILELTAAGGIILAGIGISSLLEIKKIRVGNFIPALFIAPLIVYIISLFA